MNKVESALQRTTDTKALVIGSDALPRSAEMFKELFPGKRAIIVADKITYPLAGEAVKNYFAAAGIAQDEPHVYGYDDSFAEWTYVEENLWNTSDSQFKSCFFFGSHFIVSYLTYYIIQSGR